MTNNMNNTTQMPEQLFLLFITFFKQECNKELEDFFEENKISQNNFVQSSFPEKMKIFKELVIYIFNKRQDYEILYKLAKLSTPNSLGILGYIMIHSKNVSESLNKLCKYYLLIGKRLKPVFLSTNNGFKIVINFNNEKGEIIDLEEHNVLIHLFAILHLINYIIPLDIKPIKINLSQKKPSFDIKNSEISGVKTYFAQEENAIYFDKSIKNIKTICANDHLLKIFEKEAEETLSLKLSENLLKEKISNLILISSTDLDISLESIAKKANMSQRVLQKKLKEEDTSFSKILLEVRKKLSVYYLSKDMDLYTISLNLGYIDLSSFFRAFKKWYGVTPSEYKLNKIKNKNI